MSDGVSMTGVLRPDGKWLVRPPQEHPETWAALATLATDDVGAPLLTNRPGDEDPALGTTLRSAGFRPMRTETLWRVPISSLPDRAARSPHEFVPVTELDAEAVAALDNEIRADIPGTQDWDGTADDLRATFLDPEFDPALYLIARHTGTGSLDGLIRVWNRTPVPRLGCLGVTSPWRRTSLPLGLVLAVSRTLRARGVTDIMTETDQLNSDSFRMAALRGGVRTGSLVEWERPR
jgi:hypothetical protein